jgi:hypothetical protein
MPILMVLAVAVAAFLQLVSGQILVLHMHAHVCQRAIRVMSTTSN